MSLDDLNREIYNSADKNGLVRNHEKSQYDPTVSESVPSPFDEKREWAKTRQELSSSQKKVLKVSLLILTVVVLILVGLAANVWWQSNAFNQDRVSISFEGPGEADSNQVVQYVIHYKNDNLVTLENSEIQLSYSENFQPVDNVNMKYLSPTASRIFIGDIKPGGEGSLEVKGIFYASKDTPVYLRGAISFTPSNGKSELSVNDQFGVKVMTSPVALNISAPTQAIDGDKVQYVIDYKNLDTRNLSNVQIRVEFPVGFQFVGAQPMPSQNNSWDIGNLDSSQGGKITISGTLHGNENEDRNIVVSLGKLGDDGQLALYNKREISTKIVAPILTVTQKLDGSADGIIDAGDVLNYRIAYHNSGTIGLRNAIVTVQLQGKILDFSKVNVEKGFFDGAKNTITWKASDVPALGIINPNSGGELYFSIPVKAIIPVTNKNDKNFVVSTVAAIDSPDIPTPINSNKIIGSDTLELKLASKVLLDSRGYYKDAKIQNSGPIPIQVGKETLFAVHWSLSNISNDLNNAKVVSALPSGARWTGMTYPNSEKITYDTRTNELIWDLGNVAAGSGTFLPAREVEFQVGIQPQNNQVGLSPKLVNGSTFTGSDVFTGKDVTVTIPEKNTQLLEDPSVGYEGGKVVQ